ncbi:MAG: hypothetical protein P8M08_02105 [Akkermansiaceae bacterium]|nr:hypothetical protein [Akkermansiaceae bacterium]
MKHLPLFLLLTLATAVAEVPSLINYQGRLVAADGAAQSGQKSFLLEVFDAASGGSLLYREDVGNITLGDGGVYSFQFGATGTSNTQITETIGTGGEDVLYQQVLSNLPVVANSVSVSDGTYTWSQSAGSSNEDDFNASFSTNLNRITVNYFSGAPNDGRSIDVTYRYQAEGITGALSSGGEHWLQLTIDGDVQATRERVLAVPFALKAGTVNVIPKRRAKKHIMHAYAGTGFGGGLVMVTSQQADTAFIHIPPEAKKLISITSTYQRNGSRPWRVSLMGVSGGTFLPTETKSMNIPEAQGLHTMVMPLGWELDPHKYFHLMWETENNNQPRSVITLEYEY